VTRTTILARHCGIDHGDGGGDDEASADDEAGGERAN